MTKKNNDEQSETGLVQKVSTGIIQIVEIENGNMPDLDKLNVLPIDLMAGYWTPEREGESKRLVFDRIDTRQVKDMNSDAIIDLECAFFLERVNGEIRSVSNGSKRLVGVMQSLGILRGSALEITYKGKKNNKLNSYKSDTWSVKPLIINISK